MSRHDEINASYKQLGNVGTMYDGPALTRIFCTNDNRCYGSLPGIEFKRSGTLGTGANRCDFYLRKL